MTLNFRFVIGTVMFVVAISLIIAGFLLRCGGLVIIGLATGLNAITVLSTSSHTLARNRLFTRLLVGAWLICSAGAVQVLIHVLRIETAPILHPIWATALLGLSACWFAVAQVAAIAGEKGTDSRIGVIVCYELIVISLMGAFTVYGEHSAFPLVARLEGLISIWTVASGVDGLIRMGLAFLDGDAVIDELGRAGIVRNLLYGIDDSDERVAGRMGLFDSYKGFGSVNQRSRAIASVALLFGCAWLLKGIIIVGSQERAVCFRWGRIESQPLEPGLHFRFPAPFCRVEPIAVRSLRSCPIGFEATESDFRSKPLLWTQAHGQSETAFMIGDGTELVAINAVVLYQITSDPKVLPAFVTSSIHPEPLLKLAAHRLLTAETRTVTLDQVLEKNLEVWNVHLAERLQTEIDPLVPGLQIVAFRILSVHPPIAVAASFLDQVNARIDADKIRLTARSTAAAEIFRSEMMSKSFVADAKGAAAKRLTAVVDEVAQLETLSNLDLTFPGVVRRRLYCEAIVETLEHKTITVLDAAIPSELRLSLGENSQVIRDARNVLEGR